MGKVIVFEGIDGSGTTTQIRLLVDSLKAKGIDAVSLEAPGQADSGPISRLIREYLAGKHDFSPLTLFLLYSAVHLENKEKAKALSSEGKTVFLDRYLPSAVAYQCTQGVDIGAAKSFVKEFSSDLKPDAIILLKVSPETGSARKGSGPDRHESDLALLEKASGIYEQLAEERLLGEWKIIDGEKTIEEVFKDVTKALS